VKRSSTYVAFIALASGVATTRPASAQVKLLAVGEVYDANGGYTDRSGFTNTLENGISADLLGGMGSGLAWANGNTFLFLPDRGPNATAYDDLIDDTTPLRALLPLVYGSGKGLGVGSGVPPQNGFLRHYFSGRSDNFDAKKDSGNARNARLDPEGIRVSNGGHLVYISDEYGPYVYEFDRRSGYRLRVFKLPDHLFVPNLSPVGDDEIANNTSGRTANKGMESLAITPDGKTLVGMMQAPLIQDAAQGGDAKSLLRIELIDLRKGKVTHEYAYLLTTGSGVSEVVALNDHEYLVGERDGKGRGDDSKAKVKQLFKIDLTGAVDVTDMDGLTAAGNAVNKTIFADLVAILGASGIASDQVPAKIERLALGADIDVAGVTTHTLWVANGNDFLQDFGGTNANPNNVFVFGFTDAELDGSVYVPQQFRDDCDRSTARRTVGTGRGGRGASRTASSGASAPGHRRIAVDPLAPSARVARDGLRRDRDLARLMDRSSSSSRVTAS